MPTSEPIGPLSPVTGLTPVRSGNNTPPAADSSRETPQPSPGFLSSLRKAQRSGTDSRSKAVEPSKSAGGDQTPPAAREQAGPVDPQVEENVRPPADGEDSVLPKAAAETAVAEIAGFSPEAATIQAEALASAFADISTASAVETDQPVATPAEPAVDPGDSVAALPEATVPAPRKQTPAIPSALQEWLSARPAASEKTELLKSSGDETGGGQTADEKTSRPAATIPQGLQVALAAVTAAQAAAQPVLAAKVAANTAVVEPTSDALPVAAASSEIPAVEQPEPTGPVTPAGELPPPVVTSELPTTVKPPVANAASPTVVAQVSAAPHVKPAGKSAREETTASDDDQQQPVVAAAASPVAAAVVPVATQIKEAAPGQIKSGGDEIPAVAQVARSKTPAAAVATDTSAELVNVTSAAEEAGSATLNSDNAPSVKKAAPKTASLLSSAPGASDAPATAEETPDPTAGLIPTDAPSPDPTTASAGGRGEVGPLIADRAAGAEPVPPASTIQVAPHDSQALVDRVSQLVVQSHASGHQLSLQITPPDLGTVRIEVHSHGGVLTARLEADSSAARQLLSEHLPQLREALQQQGANLDRIDVYQSDRSAQGEGMADSNWQSSQQDRQPDAPSLLYDDDEASESEAPDARGSLALGELNIRI